MELFFMKNIINMEKKKLLSMCFGAIGSRNFFFEARAGSYKKKKINFEKRKRYTTNMRGEKEKEENGTNGPNGTCGSNRPNGQKRVKAQNIFFTWRCLAVNLALTLPTLIYLYTAQMEKKGKKRDIGKTTVENIGKPLIGGNFTLINQNGKIITNKFFKNKFCLIYFGFTYCPDICPQELEKQTIVTEKITNKYGNIITPIFISVDPNRDTVAQINYYCKSFSEKLIGLTGTKELIKDVSKLFRVYYNEHLTESTSKDVGYGNNNTINKNYNYLIDHSIIHYLLDTNGKFVDFFGKNCTVNEMVERISLYIDEYLAKNKVEHV
ncbi:Cg3 protein, putative [Plasmodium malariae]|uniref:Cg3 protein, putative n=1 Tax=Plasmodium malariae TaxID=5858 RepID=A0A1C3KL50_PLAMA|nr:Cg3 protein, putative [Plasmodium malariae]